MDLRDEFAMRVAGHLACLIVEKTPAGVSRLWKPETVARESYAIADALMAERERTRKEEKNANS